MKKLKAMMIFHLFCKYFDSRNECKSDSIRKYEEFAMSKSFTTDIVIS